MSNSTSDGCVSCGPSPECPACGDDEYCIVTTLTCTQCPTTHCAPRSSSQFSALSNSTANATTSSTSATAQSNNHVTRIVVGSVIGGLAGLVLLVALLVYQWYWKARQRSRQLQLKEGMLGLGLHPEEELDDLDDLDLLTEDELDSGDESGDEARDELGSLQDYRQEYRQGPAVQPRGGVLRPPMRSSASGSRNSVSTTGGSASRHSRISLASNVLPVAYIPGVTNAGGNSTLGLSSGSGSAIRGNGSVSSAANTHTRRTPTSLNSAAAGAAARLHIAGDTGSHITLGSSILGGLDDAWDAASERGSVAGTLDSAPPDSTLGGTLGTVRIGLGNNLTTAIKARAKLVQIHEDEGGNADEQRSGRSGRSDGEPSVRSSVHSDMGSFILDVGMDAGAASPTPPAPAPAPAPAANPFDDAFELQSTGTHEADDTNGADGAARP